MKNKLILLLIALFAVAFVSCEDENNEAAEVEIREHQDLPADPSVGRDAETGAPIRLGIPGYFDLESGTEIAADQITSDNWDLMFVGTTITANTDAGAQIIMTDGVIEETQIAPESGYGDIVDDWYMYTGEAPGLPQHAILPTAGKLIIVKTAEGNYAKIQVISYYEGNPDTSAPEFANFATRPASSYYTFRYGVQEDGSRTL